MDDDPFKYPKEDEINIEFPSETGIAKHGYQNEEDPGHRLTPDFLTQYCITDRGYKATTATIKMLPAGVYLCAFDQKIGAYLQPKDLVTDKLLKFPDSRSDMILAEIERFWGLKKAYEDFGLIHKRGMLLWGPAGCHAKGTKIVMYDGDTKLVEDVVVGDLLMGPDSEPKQVLALCRGQEDLYKISPVKGDSFVVNASHVLSLISSTLDEPCYSTAANFTVKEYLALCPDDQQKLALWRSEVICPVADDHLRTGIKSIEPLGIGEYYGFTLTGNHLYLTDDFVVHHNSGKTATLALATKDMVDRGGIVLIADAPGILKVLLREVRFVETERPLTVIWEDLDAIVKQYGEPQVLEILDGESQVSGVIFIATTNYPEDLDARITNRPSRFDRVEYIGPPSAEARALYLTTKVGSTIAPDGTDLVAGTDGMSVAHLRELVAAVWVFGTPAKEVLERLRKMEKLPTSTRDPSLRGAGFKR